MMREDPLVGMPPSQSQNKLIHLISFLRRPQDNTIQITFVEYTTDCTHSLLIYRILWIYQPVDLAP